MEESLIKLTLVISSLLVLSILCCSNTFFIVLDKDSAKCFALENKSFRKSYATESSAKHLALSLSNTIKKVLEQHNIDRTKRDDMTSVYNFIETNNNISKDFGKKRNTLLQELICEINEKVRSFVKGYKFHYWDSFMENFYAKILII